MKKRVLFIICMGLIILPAIAKAYESVKRPSTASNNVIYQSFLQEYGYSDNEKNYNTVVAEAFNFMKDDLLTRLKEDKIEAYHMKRISDAIDDPETYKKMVIKFDACGTSKKAVDEAMGCLMVSFIQVINEYNQQIVDESNCSKDTFVAALDVVVNHKKLYRSKRQEITNMKNNNALSLKFVSGCQVCLSEHENQKKEICMVENLVNVVDEELFKSLPNYLWKNEVFVRALRESDVALNETDVLAFYCKSALIDFVPDDLENLQSEIDAISEKKSTQNYMRELMKKYTEDKTLSSEDAADSIIENFMLYVTNELALKHDFKPNPDSPLEKRLPSYINPVIQKLVLREEMEQEVMTLFSEDMLDFLPDVKPVSRSEMIEKLSLNSKKNEEMFNAFYDACVNTEKDEDRIVNCIKMGHDHSRGGYTRYIISEFLELEN